MADADIQAIINLGVSHGTSATAPATTVAPVNEAEVLNRLLGALDSSEFIFGRSMGWRMPFMCVTSLSNLSYPILSVVLHRDHA